MKSTAAIITLLLTCLSLSGCASFKGATAQQKLAEPETAATFSDRKRDAIASFERKRDAAQLQAAVNCWQRGEVQKSQAMLGAIVQRNPSDVTARLRLAEILVSQDETTAAESQLRECLTLAPDSAEVHHALGLLLSDLTGREQEAASHLQRACELEPENEAYAAVASTL